MTMTNILGSFFFSLGLGMLPYLIGLPKSKTGLGFVKLILLLAAVATGLFFWWMQPGLSLETITPLMIFSALLIGNTVFCMILGHWYLVVPKLDPGVIYKVFLFFWPCLFLRLAYSLAPILAQDLSWKKFLENAHSWEWMIFGMRYLWGYVILIILGFLTRKLILLRSLQSATGVLYIMVFFVFIGEILGLYMNQQFYGLN